MRGSLDGLSFKKFRSPVTIKEKKFVIADYYFFSGFVSKNIFVVVKNDKTHWIFLKVFTRKIFSNVIKSCASSAGG